MNSDSIESHGNEFLDLKPEDAQSSVWEQPASHPSSLAKPLSTSLAGLALAACGGGGGESSGVAIPNGTDALEKKITPPTETEAARFLMQASFGGTYAQVQEIQNKG